MANTFKNANLDITNSAQDIYTCPASTTAIVLSLRISNVDGSANDTITAEWVDSDGSTKSVSYTHLTLPTKRIV